MGKRNLEGLGGVALPVSAEMVQRLLGGAAPEPEVTAEERERQACEEYAQIVRQVAGGCRDSADAQHRGVHEHLEAMLRDAYRVSPLPERIREGVVRAVAAIYIHQEGNVSESVRAAMAEGRAFANLMVLAGVVALHLGVAPEPSSAAVSPISGASDSRVDHDMRAGYL